MAEYCLRWNNHQPNLVTVFSELLNAESLVDVTLATDGHFIHAHKLVLSACSVYFKDLFGSNPCKHPIVFLKDIRIEDLKTVIDFIYRGEVNVSQERLQDVLKTAESLRIKGLADKPFSYDEYPNPSQGRGQHLSSSLSSQRSSLNDSREQAQSVDNEDGAESAAGGGTGTAGNSSPPASKKRKVASHDSSESLQQDTNHEGEEKHSRGDAASKDDAPKKSCTPIAVNEEGKSKSCLKDKIKEEKDAAAITPVEPRPEFQESRAADAMLMLQGSSSDGGDDGGAAPLPATSVARDSAAGIISSHSQGFPGRPPNASYPLSSNPYSKDVGGKTGREGDPYFGANCCRLIVRPKLKASDGSYVTIRTGTADNFLQAVEDVREGRMGFCKAGRIYGVNHATLQKFYKAMGYHVRNRSNNPNFFLKSPTPSDREREAEGEGEEVDFVSESMSHHPTSTHDNGCSQYNPSTPYSTPRSYQHFMSPLSSANREHSLLAPYEHQRGGGAPSTALKGGTDPSLHESLSNKLESYTAGRLLNYTSLYCETIGMTDGAEKGPSHSAPPQPCSSSSQHHGTPLNSAARSSGGTNVLDVNAPFVLCNL